MKEELNRIIHDLGNAIHILLHMKEGELSLEDMNKYTAKSHDRIMVVFLLLKQLRDTTPNEVQINDSDCIEVKTIKKAIDKCTKEINISTENINIANDLMIAFNKKIDALHMGSIPCVFTSKVYSGII